MFLDADRDGVVDAAATNYANWQYGAGNPGAVIMPNTRPVNPGHVVPARIEVRFTWGATGVDPGGWTARLTLDHPNRIRVFDGNTQGAAQLAPAAGVIDLAAAPGLGLAAGPASIWVEAGGHPGGHDPNDWPAPNEADWRISMTFDFTPSNGPVIQQQAELRIAPWIMAHDLHVMNQVCFVGAPGALSPMQTQLNNFVVGQGVAAHPIAPNGAAPKPFVRDVLRCGWIAAPHHTDVVMLTTLDEGSPYGLPAGHANTGSVPYNRIVAPGPAQRTSQDNGGNLMVSPPVPQYPYGRIICGDHPGLRCNPLAYFRAQRSGAAGVGVAPAPPVQDPIIVDSSWLYVGHSDEFIGFVPSPGGPWPYKIVLASPRLGYLLAMAALSPHPGALTVDQRIAAAHAASAAALADERALVAAPVPAAARNANVGHLVPPAAVPHGALWARVQHHAAVPFPPPGAAIAPAVAVARGPYAADAPPPVGHDQHMVKANTDLPGPNYGGQPLDAYLASPGVGADPASGVGALPYHQVLYEYAQPKIDAARRALLDGLGLAGPNEDQHVIEIPVLLRLELDKIVPDTADAVNMLVLNDHCLVPKPYGPVCNNVYIFQECIEQSLTAAGLTPHFLNDWDAFHREDGEIHCGTNSVPNPLAGGAERWWQ